jgi:hypothetical protein
MEQGRQEWLLLGLPSSWLAIFFFAWHLLLPGIQGMAAGMMP